MELSLMIDNRVLDGFCAKNFYTDTARDIDGNVIPNPETKQMFLQRFIIDFISEAALNFEKTQSIIDADFNFKDFLVNNPDALSIKEK